MLSGCAMVEAGFNTPEAQQAATYSGETELRSIKASIALYKNTAVLMYALGGGWCNGTNTLQTSAETSVQTIEKQS